MSRVGGWGEDVHLVVQLASLSGDVFPDEEDEVRQECGLLERHADGEHTSPRALRTTGGMTCSIGWCGAGRRTGWWRQVREGGAALQWLEPLPSAAALCGHGEATLSDTREAEVRDACRVVNALATIHALPLLQRSVLSGGGLSLLESITTLTCECLSAGALTDESQRDSLAGDAARLLLDGWLDLLGLGLIADDASQSCLRIFDTFLQRALLDASRGAFDEEDEEEQQYAAIATREENLDTVGSFVRGCSLRAAWGPLTGLVKR
eukprot:scaffold7876_cov417-Prasinococcus_capsulatus_cf.AAC.9